MTGYDVFVVGSANIDQTVVAERMPEEGETVHGLDYKICCGGKGANQAVAAARAAASTAFLGCVGDDEGGRIFRNKFAAEKINCDGLWNADKPTGIAQICLTTAGNNSIVVYAGANGCIQERQIKENAANLNESKIVLLQNEVPEEVNTQVARALKNDSVKLVLNPAPARKSKSELLKRTDCIIPNQSEAQLITGIKITDEQTLKSCVESLHSLGIAEVIITLGSDGCFVSACGKQQHIKPQKVNVVNTIGAGDCFCGVFCAMAAAGKDVFQAAEYAVRASSISVTKNAAMDSMPLLKEFYP